jgi:hypothetical protein
MRSPISPPPVSQPEKEAAFDTDTPEQPTKRTRHAAFGSVSRPGELTQLARRIGVEQAAPARTEVMPHDLTGVRAVAGRLSPLTVLKLEKPGR